MPPPRLEKEVSKNTIRSFPVNKEESNKEGGGSASPIIDLFLNESGPGVFKAMAALIRLEFKRVWDWISVLFIAEYWNGRGRPPTTNLKDKSFILVSVLSLPATWANHSSMFAMSAQRVDVSRPTR